MKRWQNRMSNLFARREQSRSVERHNSPRHPWLAGPYIFWAAGFIVLPLVLVFYYGLSGPDGTFTLANLAAIAQPIFRNALGQSLLISFGTTAICLVLAYPLAYILSKNRSRSGAFIIILIVLPMWINFLLRILAVQMLIANNGIINMILGHLGLAQMRLINTRAAIFLGTAYDYFPFMVLPIYNAMCKIDHDIIEAAHDLGANALTTFRRIIVPLSLPGVISGIIMVFIPSISEFAIADILGGSRILLFGNVIEQEFNMSNDWHTGSGLSLILMVFIIISMIVMHRVDKDGEGQIIW